MNNKEFSKLFEKRTLDFGVRIVRLSASLPNTPEGREIRKQITESGTSIGANYHEANRARSKADFRSKIRIGEGETSETQYWLEMSVALGWLSMDEVRFEFKECSELLPIFTSISSK
jgi:four helix bundle protein